MSSLLALTLAKIPLEELKEICYGPPNPLKNQLLEKCDWEVWRDRAEAVFNVPPDYFDLPLTYGVPRRNISGLQRYVEIATYFKLGPYSPVAVYENGFIEGVYESIAGVYEAIYRRDITGLDIFFPRLSDFNKEFFRTSEYTIGKVVLNRFPPFSIEVNWVAEDVINTVGLGPIENIADYTDVEIRTLIKYGNPYAFQAFFEKGVRDKAFFRATIKSGNVAWIEALLGPFLHIDISILDSIPFSKFKLVSPTEKNPFPLIDLPVKMPDYEDSDRIINAAMFSCNVQVFDFFRSLFLVEKPKLNYRLSNGYNFHRKPVEAYSILQRCSFADISPEMVNDLEKSNIDISLRVISEYFRDANFDREAKIRALTHYLIIPFLGNIPALIALLDVLVEENPEKKDYENILNDFNHEMYPLSAMIIKSYI